jgi:hypothetical protein
VLNSKANPSCTVRSFDRSVETTVRVARSRPVGHRSIDTGRSVSTANDEKNGRDARSGIFSFHIFHFGSFGC